MEQTENHNEIRRAADRRGITQVVHFTTLRGAVGILASGCVKSRSRLDEDKHLEFVFNPNVRLRKDPEWLDYVNLSVERINDWMFATSTSWHATEGNPWVVFSFNPRILAHPGVVFTTTNNIYPRCTRAPGLGGFNNMFAETVFGKYSKQHDREGKSASWTTDRQAEVLYPGELSCDHLQRIDVQIEESLDDIHGIISSFSLDVQVQHAPEVFQ